MNNLIRLSSSFAEGTAGYESSFAVPLGAAALQQEEPMLDQLDRRERLRLVQFVCSFAWADFEIQPEERVFISRLIRRLELGEEDDLQVQQWLDRLQATSGEIEPLSQSPRRPQIVVAGAGSASTFRR